MTNLFWQKTAEMKHTLMETSVGLPGLERTGREPTG
jgi:hypothetical protein